MEYASSGTSIYGVFTAFRDGSVYINRYLVSGNENNFVRHVYFKLTVDAKIADWAGLKDAIAFIAGHQILNGVGNNRFDPKGNASVQEAMVIALRMFENLK